MTGFAGLDDRLVRRVESMREEMVDLLCRLVRIPSVNPRFPGVVYDDVVGYETEVSRMLAGVWGEFTTDVSLFGSEAGRQNASATVHGTGGGRSLLIAGHVDVVPAGDASGWSGGDPFAPVVREGKVWGRGAADQKAGLVAQSFAGLALAREGISLRGDLILQGVVGEEMMEADLGIRPAVRWPARRPDAAIVSEGTQEEEDGRLNVCIASPGVAFFSVSVRGVPGHPSLRGLVAPSVNAIDKMLVVVVPAIRQLEAEWRSSKSHPLFPRGHFAIHSAGLRASAMGFESAAIVPDLCTMDLTCWYPPGMPPHEVAAEVAAAVSKAAEGDEWLRHHPPELELGEGWPPLATSPAEPFVETMLHARDAVQRGSLGARHYSAVCDGAFIAGAGIPTIVCGPGSLRQAHAVDEWVSVDALVAACKAYALAALRWCGPS